MVTKGNCKEPVIEKKTNEDILVQRLQEHQRTVEGKESTDPRKANQKQANHKSW